MKKSLPRTSAPRPCRHLHLPHPASRSVPVSVWRCCALRAKVLRGSRVRARRGRQGGGRQQLPRFAPLWRHRLHSAERHFFGRGSRARDSKRAAAARAAAMATAHVAALAQATGAPAGK